MMMVRYRVVNQIPHHPCGDGVLLADRRRVIDAELLLLE
jgi:hypothetical protein